MNRTVFQKLKLYCLIIPFALWVSSCVSGTDSKALHTFEGQTMGTNFSIKLVGTDLNEERLKALRMLVEDTLQDIDKKMSTYRQDSELSRFNKTNTTEPFHVSADMLSVFQHALDISELTYGAFDITVGPMVDAWGFGPLDEPTELPAEDDIERLKSQVDYRKLEINITEKTIRKLSPILACDLSGIAKGYAVDQIADLLSSEGIESYLVEIGGEVRTLGFSDRGDHWYIGIERPALGFPSIQRLVPLHKLSLATSGDYRNYYEIEGQRLSHMIDPRTGRPVSHSLTAVSVIEPLCVRADAIATALEVLGLEDGFALAVERGWAALFVIRNEDGTLYERETPAFNTVTDVGVKSSRSFIR